MGLLFSLFATNPQFQPPPTEKLAPLISAPAVDSPPEIVPPPSYAPPVVVDERPQYVSEARTEAAAATSQPRAAFGGAGTLRQLAERTGRPLAANLANAVAKVPVKVPAPPPPVARQLIFPVAQRLQNAGKPLAPENVRASVVAGLVQPTPIKQAVVSVAATAKPTLWSGDGRRAEVVASAFKELPKVPLNAGRRSIPLGSAFDVGVMHKPRGLF